MQYSNMFNKKDEDKYKDMFKDNNQMSDKKYGSIFDNSVKTEVKTENKKNYDLFSNVENIKPVTKPTPPELFTRDPRHDIILAINGNIATNTVLFWIDNFSSELKMVSVINQKLADDQLKMAQGYSEMSSYIRNTFSKIKDILNELKPPEKPSSFLGKLFSSQESKKPLTPSDIDAIITKIKESIVSTKYPSTMFIDAELKTIGKQISDIKMRIECGMVACTYFLNQGENHEIELAQERLQKIKQLNDISEISLYNTHKQLLRDMNKYEELKDITVPLLYVKLHNLLNNSSDVDALNLITQINEL